MNPNPPINPMGDVRPPNPHPRQAEGNIPFGINNPMGPPQPRPRMEQMNPNNQQPYPPQQKMPMNYQQGPRPPQPAQGMPRPNGPYQNMTPEELQRMGGPVQGPRGFPGPQQRFPGPQPQPQPPQMRPPMNEPPRFMNHQQMDPMRAQAPRPQLNHQPGLDMNGSAIRNPPQILSRKSSNLEMSPPQMMNHQKLADLGNKFQHELGAKTVNEKRIEEQNSNPQFKKEEQFEDETPKDSDTSQDSIKSDEKEKEVKQKEKKPKEKPPKPKIDCSIASGLVNKNIKYFEENDTAKTPLTPQELKAERKQKRTESVSSDVVKSEFYEDEYESGVDDTPMVFPNLKSIYQTPSKVARIPYLKTKKSKSRLKSERKPKPRGTPMSPRSKQRSLHSGCVGHSKYWNNEESPYKPSKKKEKIDYGPDEELLAFFEGSKSYKKYRRGEWSSKSKNINTF